LYGQTAEPLTVRAIIHRIEKKWRSSTAKLTHAERAFLASFAGFAAAKDRGLFIQDSFLQAAIEGGRTLKTHTTYIHHDEGRDEAGSLPAKVRHGGVLQP
jgi:hypothetical protein